MRKYVWPFQYRSEKTGIIGVIFLFILSAIFSTGNLIAAQYYLTWSFDEQNPLIFYGMTFLTAGVSIMFAVVLNILFVKYLNSRVK